MKYLSLILLLVLMCLVCFNNVDCKKQSKKKKASKDENVATFSSREQLTKHMKDMTEKEKQGALNETPSEEEMLELRKEEIRILLSYKRLFSCSYSAKIKFKMQMILVLVSSVAGHMNLYDI